MIRFGMLAVLVAVTLCDVAEARGRNRGMRTQGTVWRTQSPVRYHSGTSQVVTVQNAQGPIRTVSYSNEMGSTQVQGSTRFQGNSMQAWAEEEARMMAERGTCGHIRSAPPGYFVGVGCGMTCIGSGTLVAEARYQGKMVRVWKR